MDVETPPGTSEYTMHIDEKDARGTCVYCRKTVLLYDARCVDDLYAMLKSAGDWVELVAQTNRSRQGRDRGELGPLAREPNQRLVWVEKRLAAGVSPSIFPH